MVTEHQILPDLAGLFEALHADGRAIIGPTVRGNAIVPAEIDEPSDLPYGGAANVDAGQYRLRHDAEPLAFTHTSGPQSWKQVVHPPKERLGGWPASRSPTSRSHTRSWR